MRAASGGPQTACRRLWGATAHSDGGAVARQPAQPSGQPPARSCCLPPTSVLSRGPSTQSSSSRMNTMANAEAANKRAMEGRRGDSTRCRPRCTARCHRCAVGLRGRGKGGRVRVVLQESANTQAWLLHAPAWVQRGWATACRSTHHACCQAPLPCRTGALPLCVVSRGAITRRCLRLSRSSAGWWPKLAHRRGSTTLPPSRSQLR